MDVTRRKIKIFQDSNGNEPFTKWIKTVSTPTRARVFAKLDRVETGNLGDCRFIGEGVSEFRLHFGPGYRIYYGEFDNTIILLPCGGDKSTQAKDVKKAKKYWNEYISRRMS
jgi:putative addiction module killer protein